MEIFWYLGWQSSYNDFNVHDTIGVSVLMTTDCSCHDQSGSQFHSRDAVTISVKLGIVC